MAKLTIPSLKEILEDFNQVKERLDHLGIFYDRWVPKFALSKEATQEEILEAFSESLTPFMKERGYSNADVISVFPDTENLLAIRQKFLPEHTHSEDEVRYFVEGSGWFWFHLEEHPVFCVRCEKGDVLSVPARTKHWFDLGEVAYVRAIRIFQTKEGWVANYTNSGIDQQYNPSYE